MTFSNFFIQSIEIDHSEYLQDYLNQISAIRNLKKIIFETPITFLVGENGTGKSTLLEAIAVNYGFNAEGGSLNYSFSTNDSHSNLYKFI